MKRNRRPDVKGQVEAVFGIQLKGLNNLKLGERRRIWNWLTGSAQAGQKSIDRLEDERGLARKPDQGVS